MPMLDEGQHRFDMLAAAVAQKAEALARTVLGPADAYVVEIAQTEAVDREATPANGAEDLLEHVKHGPFFRRNGENARFRAGGRLHQAQDPR